MGKNALGVRISTELICSVLLGIALPSQQLDAQHDLTTLLNLEKSQHSLLTYTQRYVTDENSMVEYAGTIYFQIESFTVNGCVLKFDVLVQDRFTGSEDKRKHLRVERFYVGQRSFTYRYSYELSLKEDPFLQVESVLARPEQLRGNTGFFCEEDATCKLQWLHIKTTRPRIRETRVLNGFVDLDQSIDEMAIPMTSREIGTQSAKSVQKLAAACR